MEENKGEKSRRRFWLIIAVASFVLCVVCVAVCIRYCTPRSVPVIETSDTSYESEPADNTENESTADTTSEAEITVRSPIDFTALQADNPDIYAWITIPGTKINYPIVQHPDNNEYYLRRDCYKNSYIGGCIFTENYNLKDFSDANTLIYGHSGMSDDSMFTQLLDMSGIENFENIRQIYIYTPERMFTYEIFAAYPFSNRHVLLNYDFTTEDGFNQFFDEVYATLDMRAVFSEDFRPQFGVDRIVTLSTCLDGNSERRYLVQGYLTSEAKAIFIAADTVSE